MMGNQMHGILGLNNGNYKNKDEARKLSDRVPNAPPQEKKIEIMKYFPEPLFGFDLSHFLH